MACGEECPILRSNLSAYLTNDSTPSPEDILKTMELRQEPINELKEVAELIAEAQKSLDILKVKQDALQNSIRRCDIILSPFRRIPIDVLGEIFFHCLSEYPTLSYREAPLLLTHVCSSWRSIILSTQEMWTNIHVPIFDITFDPIWSLNSSDVDDPEIFAMNDKMLYRCRQIEEWLSRAGAHRLSISLASRSSGIYYIQPTSQQMLNAVFSRRDRIEHLKLDIPAFGEAYDYIIKLTAEDLPALDKLCFKDVNPQSLNWHEYGIFNAPRLRKLVVNNLFREQLFPVSPIWKNLISLNIAGPISLIWAKHLLLHCHRLVFCSLAIGSGQEDSEKGTIILPDLKYFTLMFDSKFSKLINTVDAPKLRHLEFLETTDAAGTTESLLLTVKPSCLSQLTALSFNPDLFKEVEILQLFRCLPSITSLFLGRRIPGTRLYTLHHFSMLQILSTPQSLQDHCNTITPNQGMNFLLPKLEVLGMECGRVTSDREILDFIIARLDPLREGISRLKKVYGYFLRQKQMDISRQVEYHASQLGLVMSLELFYKPSVRTGFSSSLWQSEDPFRWDF